MRRVVLSLFACLMVLCIGCPLQPRQVFAQQQTVTDTVQFRVVSASDFRPLSNARVIVVAQDGRMLKTGLTSADGTWSAPITVPYDPRFKDIGIITAICVANGHNEHVVFDVPVKQGTVQPITMYPIQPRLRNEASASLGQLHHLDIIDIVNKYAGQVGLARQKGIVGEQGYAPWGPYQTPRG